MPGRKRHFLGPTRHHPMSTAWTTQSSCWSSKCPPRRIASDRIAVVTCCSRQPTAPTARGWPTDRGQSASTITRDALDLADARADVCQVQLMLDDSNHALSLEIAERQHAIHALWRRADGILDLPGHARTCPRSAHLKHFNEWALAGTMCP